MVRSGLFGLGRSRLRGLNWARRTWLLALLLPLALIGCASAPPSAQLPSEMVQAFALQGRVSIRYGAESLSGQLDWRADVASDEVLLSSPLGQGIASIRRHDGGVSLIRPGQPMVTAESVEMLTLSELGFRLPLTGLRYWVQARPDPARASKMHFSAAGGVDQIAQDGWKIDYLAFQGNLPRKIHISREDLEIRLVIDAWRTN